MTVAYAKNLELREKISVIAHNIFLSRHGYIPVKGDEIDNARLEMIIRFIEDTRKAGYDIS